MFDIFEILVNSKAIRWCKKLGTSILELFPWFIKRRKENMKAMAVEKVENEKITEEGKMAVMEIRAGRMVEVSKMLESQGYLASWQQGNLTAIIRPAIENGKNIENIEKEFKANYVEKGKNVSNEKMQKLWTKVLMGEADAPGSFSKKTLSILGDMDKGEAELFATLCQFVWVKDDEEIVPLIANNEDVIYTAKGIQLESLRHLDNLGLISYTEIRLSSMLITFGNESETEIPDTIWCYHDKTVRISSTTKIINIGSCRMTREGKELFRICDVRKNDEFFDYMINKWQEDGFYITILPEQQKD